MKLQIKTHERAFFVGTTGSGKTELAKHFLSRMNRVLVIDPKFEFTLDGFRRAKSLPYFGNNFKIIYRPRDEDDFDLSQLIHRIFKMRNAVIYVDELATIVEQFPYTIRKLSQVVREGRGKKVQLWSATQRPRRIPLIFKTESENIFQFFLRDEDDRDHMTGYIGREANDPLEFFNFRYIRPGMKLSALLHLDLKSDKIIPVQNTLSNLEALMK
jgi:hypothetical protein